MINEFDVLIEIPKGSFVKYEIDKATGLFRVDRFIHTAIGYPFNYGYLPGTLALDGDPIDFVVISTHPVQCGTILPSRVIGMLKMEDESGVDNKIIAIPTDKIDPFQSLIRDIDDLSPAQKILIKHFFETYKLADVNRWAKVGDFVGKSQALQEIASCII
jgi:inorganic pyrophosphatase